MCAKVVFCLKTTNLGVPAISEPGLRTNYMRDISLMHCMGAASILLKQNELWRYKFKLAIQAKLFE